MFFTLEKPNLNKIYSQLMTEIFAVENQTEISDFIIRYCNGAEYLYWDKFRYKEPMPKEVSKEELWKIIKFLRVARGLKTVIKDKNGKFFTWSKLDYFDDFFYELNMGVGKGIFIDEKKIANVGQQKLIVHGIIEEAIASSQLEGAATSRLVAKKMLQEGRKPRNQSEQMIVNGYAVMKAIEDNYRKQAMSEGLLLELHDFITKDTLDSADEKPRMRKEGEPIYITDRANGLIYHEGPKIDFVKKELKTLVKFANDELQDKVFIHPIVKAIMLHFWMGYLHPFTDGNGRLARVLFYWYLLRKGYQTFAYLPISKMIKQSSRQYIMSYVYSEQDDNDLNYFIDYNLKKIKLAIKDFQEYLEKQTEGKMQIKENCAFKYQLNSRQIQLLQYFYKNPGERTTLKTHVNINQITKMTASKDLKDLVKKKFLLVRKLGRNVYYLGTEKTKTLFN